MPVGKRALLALLVSLVAGHAAGQTVTTVTVEAGRSDLNDRWRPLGIRGFLGLDKKRNRAGGMFVDLRLSGVGIDWLSASAGIDIGYDHRSARYGGGRHVMQLGVDARLARREWYVRPVLRAGVLMLGLPAGWSAPVGRFGTMPSFGGGVYVGRRRAGVMILADHARSDQTRILLFRFGGYYRLWGE